VQPATPREEAAPAPAVPATLQMQQLREHLAQVERAHLTFLQTRQQSLEQLGELIALQHTTAQRILESAPVDEPAAMPVSQPAQPVPLAARPAESTPVMVAPQPVPHRPDALFHEEDILEFANGSIAAVFGEEYAEIDTFSRRVRLPGPPYLFISRVTKLDARRGEFGPCSIQTEYDVPHGAWYIADGQVPSTVAIEASHGNMFLASYLGVDFENRGERVYRALDGHVTFLGDMAREGDTLICDVMINSFAQNGDTRIFFYTYDCNVRESSGLVRPLLTMNGIAGFFSDEQLVQGKGAAPEKALDALLRSQQATQIFRPPLTCSKPSFDERDLAALIQGDLESCFGSAYAQTGRNPRLRLPSTHRMLDRVTRVEPTGGTHELGMLRGEKDLRRDEWYFQCHFKDDLCLPGTVAAEGAVQMLQFYLLYAGLQTRTTDARFQPVLHEKMIGQSRGQITPRSGTLVYELDVTDVSLSPEPYAMADITVRFEDRIVARCKNMGLRLVEEQR
jgi:3-hydroxymyristoyl/3-hydroxydecanoyl-(acyl carrier protein) dehydratase